MKRKIIVSMLSMILVFSTLFVPISFASSSPNGEGKHGEIQPQAIPYYVDKPIADTAMITNAQLGQMLEERRQSVGWYSIVTGLASFIRAFSIPGAVNSIVATLSGMSDTQLDTAYRNGQNVYVAILNANGEPTGSLTKEAVVVPSSSPIIFQYRQ